MFGEFGFEIPNEAANHGNHKIRAPMNIQRSVRRKRKKKLNTEREQNQKFRAESVWKRDRARTTRVRVEPEKGCAHERKGKNRTAYVSALWSLSQR